MLIGDENTVTEETLMQSLSHEDLRIPSRRVLVRGEGEVGIPCGLHRFVEGHHKLLLGGLLSD